MEEKNTNVLHVDHFRFNVEKPRANTTADGIQHNLVKLLNVKLD